MNIDSWAGRSFSTGTRLLMPSVFFLASLCAHHGLAHAQSTGSPFAGRTAEDAARGSIDAVTFRFNDRYTTPFGPAYADIWLVQSDFLACKPPVGRSFSYALCYFSGPAVGTPAPTDGTASVNPPLPCILSPDGKSANCTCYEISTEEYPPVIPYFVSINAILNLNLYLRTIAACGHDGELCSPQAPIRDGTWWNPAPVCRAANTNDVIPGAELISVFSTLKNADYDTGTTPNSTTCAAGKYAGCMTAPCRHTGRQDEAGNDLAECTCPVYDGPFELGQAGVPCDANELMRPTAAALSAVPADAAASRKAQPRAPVYVWSAAHNPLKNHKPIDPPATGCLPDVAGDKGCPLYSPVTQYPVARGHPLCRSVCEAYRTGISQSTSKSPAGVQVGYSCDATLCTTVGIGQTAPPPVNPLGKANLLRQACGGLAELSGLQAILALEKIDQCSCCASQVCGCDNAGSDIDSATQAEIAKLNAEQERLEITPQCQINGTLCGAGTP